jgi:Putative peptidoglycan binding domain
MEPLLRLHDGFMHTSPDLAPAVRRVQRALRRYRPEVLVDGLFGPGTAEAVRDFQRDHDLPVDGVVGPRTWQALERPPGLAEDGVPFVDARSLEAAELLADLELAARFGALIDQVASETGFAPSLIAALGSTASGWGRALTPQGAAGTADFLPRPYRRPHRPEPLPADGLGFGRGLLQIDYDHHQFARSGRWQDPLANIRYGCSVLTEARTLLRGRTSLGGRGLLRGGRRPELRRRQRSPGAAPGR